MVCEGCGGDRNLYCKEDREEGSESSNWYREPAKDFRQVSGGLKSCV